MLPASTQRPETSTLRLSPEGLSIHMRIPAERPYLRNAILTLREICDHLNIDPARRNRIVLALEEALLNAVEHAYNGDGHLGQIDLQFTIEGDEFLVMVEDFGQGISPEQAMGYIHDDRILEDRGRGLCILRGMSDRSVVQATERGTRATMMFHLPSNA
ncbi:MAG: hypothetical protein OZSIB_4167 [Candidatus Ozemobacter sibiricus]|uniref:Histidine kinase/HSP90-like ATPase domain-containing protein n=1 Tax=Candidatus Ozemobacter sibiricus TaxID=2268124 RepID=A0A367ZNJ3_9BACT|nr:MAG: hypothetical protein OZSIB_4167 [Candidatus Ozemobacter sibiricus]